MGQSLGWYGEGGGITNPWGSGWGPSGQGGDPNLLDPGNECLEQWNAMQSSGMGGAFNSYADFAAVFCP